MTTSLEHPATEPAWRGALREWGLTLRNLFLPVFCHVCGQRLLTEENGYFCPTCWEESPRIERPFCTVCGRPHPPAIGFSERRNFPCATCRARKRAPAYGRIFGAAYYEGAVAEAIKLLKFSEKVKLAGPLAELMAAFASQDLDGSAYDALVPVPLHRVRERERGFNQSRLLAQRLLPCFPRASLLESVKRIRPTRVQSRLTDEAERRANVKGAFAVEPAAPELRGRRVLLIDDVVTSGGTVSECAAALRRGGADQVDVFAAALAVHPL